MRTAGPEGNARLTALTGVALMVLLAVEGITLLSWVFNYVYVLTSGGPGYASSVMELYIWRSFSNGADGTAASVAVMLSCRATRMASRSNARLAVGDPR